MFFSLKNDNMYKQCYRQQFFHNLPASSFLIKFPCDCHCSDVLNTEKNHSSIWVHQVHLCTLINSINLSFSCYSMPWSHFRSFSAIICLQETLCGDSVDCIRQVKAGTSIIYASSTFSMSNLASTSRTTT